MKIPGAKAVDKEWTKLETTPAWQLGKVKSKKEAILEAQRDCHLNAELHPKLQKYKGRAVLRGDTIKIRLFFLNWVRLRPKLLPPN